ncbi:MAG: low temperature requirement protein A [Dehalococcoidia bacterium]
MAELWRPPALRGAEHANGAPAVSWIELFYDLVFVVAIAGIGHRFIAAPGRASAVEFVVLFGMLWWAWASLTFVVDRFESNDAIDRVLAVFQMFGVAAFAAAASREASLDAIAAPLAASYTITRLVLIAMYARAWWHVTESRPLVGGYLRGFGLDAALWALSIAVPSPARYAMWAAAMAISLATPWLMRRTQARSPLNASHLPERFGLFTILVLGESVAAVVAGLHPDQAHATTLAGAGAAFVVATGLWWIYFDNFEGSVVRRDPDRRHDWRPTAWIYAHFPLAACLAAAGNGMGHLITAGEAHESRALVITCSTALAGALLAMAVILVSTAGGDVASRTRRATARAAGALLAVAVAASGAPLTPAAYLVTLAAILLSQVLFDVTEHARAARAARTLRAEAGVTS